jgi:thioredoxin
MDMKNMTELTEANFKQEVIEAAGPVLVDFHATWCGPCKMLAPLLAQFAKEFEGRIKFAKLDVDDAPQIAARYEITGVPTMILLSDGRVVDRVVGLPAPRSLKAWLEKAAATPATAPVLSKLNS